MRSKERKELLQALIEEQGYICCYCGMEISDRISHIEHLAPQSTHPELSLEYTNLLASCGISDRIIAKNLAVTHCEAHCGRIRGNKYLSVDPTDPDCETKFRYTGEGEVLPNNDSTVMTLNLNYTELKKLRKAAIEGVISLFEDEFSNEEIDLFIKSFEKRDLNGKFQPFCFAVTYFLKSYI